MIVRGPFSTLVRAVIALDFVRTYREDDPSDYWEAEAMGLGYQGA